MKILKNTTLTDIELKAIGRTVPASSILSLDSDGLALLATNDALTEINSYLITGDIVVNDGISDLNAADGYNYLKWPDQAQNIRFDNSVNGFNSTNVQKAIEENKNFRYQYVSYQFIGEMNFNRYLFAGQDYGSITRESGDPSNGYRFSNSAPFNAAFTGQVVNATASIRGIAQSAGSPAANLELKFELWKVGMTGNEGTKLGDITFNIISSNYTIGNFWNSSVVTQFEKNQTQNVNVAAGDLLGLKFISQTGNNKVVSVQNTTIVLEIQGQA